VAIIESKAGAVRSLHYHRSDAHWLYVLSGEMHYYEREVGYVEWPTAPLIVGPGQCVFTPSMVEHKTVFPVATVLVSMSLRPRDAGSHESDVVRL
jgi:Mannose-6-phosphate isomerase